MTNLSEVMGIFSDILTKSRFEQQPIKGNTIPRPNPKKNTTPGNNEDESSVILAKESPIQGPGIPSKHSEPSKEVVGKGRKAAHTIITDDGGTDDATYVVGMEKADRPPLKPGENTPHRENTREYGNPQTTVPNITDRREYVQRNAPLPRGTAYQVSDRGKPHPDDPNEDAPVEGERRGIGFKPSSESDTNKPKGRFGFKAAFLKAFGVMKSDRTIQQAKKADKADLL